MERKRHDGFTLIELMVVVAVLAILAAAIIPRFAGKAEKAKRARAKADVTILMTVLEAFYSDVDRYPTTSEGLDALRHRPDGLGEDWDGPYLMREVSLDPWKNPYVYVCPGAHNPESYDLKSCGADGQDGGEGKNKDIESWGRIDED